MTVTGLVQSPCLSATQLNEAGRERDSQHGVFVAVQDGMLCCHAGAMCVQAVGGIQGLQDGQLLQPLHSLSCYRHSPLPLTPSSASPTPIFGPFLSLVIWHLYNNAACGLYLLL